MNQRIRIAGSAGEFTSSLNDEVITEAKQLQSIHRSMHVLMVSDTLGGVWTYSLDLIRELHALQIQVSLATLGHPLSRAQRQQVRELPGLDIYESSFALEWMEEPWKDLERAGRWLLNLEEELSPDILHFNQYCFAPLPWKAPKIIVAHSDLLSWRSAIKNESSPSQRDLYRSRVREGLHAADLVITPSKTALTDLENGYGPLGKTRVIPHGRFISHSAQFTFSKKDLILSAGRLWDAAKNVQSLDRIAGDLPWSVCAAGSTQNPNGQKAEFKNLKWLGHLPPSELKGYYEKASIYVLPASYEPFGLSILEAAQNRCALVLGDIPSLRENWQNSALFVDPESPEALKEALTYLIRNPAVREEMAQKAKERSRFFSSRRMAKDYAHEFLCLKESAGVDLVPSQLSSTSQVIAFPNRFTREI